MASPPKPWETATGVQASTTMSGSVGPSLDASVSNNLASSQMAAIGPTAAGYASAGLPGTSAGIYGAAASPYGPSSPYGAYGAAGASPYGSAYGSAYGASPYGSYGASSPYGASSLYGGGSAYGSAYGSYGGYGSSMGGYGGYGGGYGGMSSYGGGYGSYGRYGGGYGGMGMGMGMGGPGMMGQEMGWLGGLHQTIGSMGQISELLGMNAEAMQFAFSAFGNFLERIGGVTQEVFAFFVGTPPPLSVDPRTGQPVTHVIDPRTGQPVIDPRTGQPVRVPTPEEYKVLRKRRFIRWVLGVFVVYLGFRLIRNLFRSRRSSTNPGLNSAFMEVAARQQGGQGYGMSAPGGSLFDAPMGGAQAYPAFRGGGLTDSLESAFSGAKKNIF